MLGVGADSIGGSCQLDRTVLPKSVVNIKLQLKIESI